MNQIKSSRIDLRKLFVLLIDLMKDLISFNDLEETNTRLPLFFPGHI